MLSYRIVFSGMGEFEKFLHHDGMTDGVEGLGEIQGSQVHTRICRTQYRDAIKKAYDSSYSGRTR